jgi:hypothetical protein
MSFVNIMSVGAFRSALLAVLLGLAAATPGIAPAFAGPTDEFNACNDKLGRELDKLKKSTDGLNGLFKKAKNSEMHKTEPVKYCDWHKKNVMTVLIQNVRRMEVLAKDTECMHDTIAVQSFERLAQGYKEQERWMSSLCLGIHPY